LELNKIYSSGVGTLPVAEKIKKMKLYNMHSSGFCIVPAKGRETVRNTGILLSMELNKISFIICEGTKRWLHANGSKMKKKIYFSALLTSLLFFSLPFGGG
jgi:hypothetical protein